MERAGRVRLNILGVREDDKWCAIALEMSLRGYGETFEEALDDLKETIIVQVTYAIKHHSSIDHILIPAESHYFEIFAIAKREALKQSFSKRGPSQQAEYLMGSMPVPRIKTSVFLQPEPVPVNA